jgi:hypothetical protein
MSIRTSGSIAGPGVATQRTKPGANVPKIQQILRYKLLQSRIRIVLVVAIVIIASLSAIHLTRAATLVIGAEPEIGIRNVSAGSAAFTSSAQFVSFTFASGGDIGANGSTTTSLGKLDVSGAEFFLALGDLDYDETPTDEDWCTYVKSNLPTLFTNPSYPFQILPGNHEEQTGEDGYVMNHAACLPDRMNATGTYPAQYYFDYPATNSLMRVIMISPDLTVENNEYSYASGTVHNTWLTNAIDQARAAGIPWVTIGMHKVCISAGTKSCEVSESLVNMLVSKKVDLILQGHEHNYQRSHQFSHSSGCTALSDSAFDADCIVTNAA